MNFLSQQSCTFDIVSPILKLPSVVCIAAFFAGAFAHPLMVLVIYRTILLRERAGGNRNLGVERYLMVFNTIGIIMVLLSAICEFYLGLPFQHEYLM